MSQLSLTSLQARNLILYSQRLLAPRGIPAQKSDLVDLIQELGVLQIDTIHVVARSPYFSLWSRLGNYDPDWLNQLLAEKQIFEGWAHAASFLPVQDYPYHRRLILENMRLPRYRLWYAQHKKECDDILAHVQKNGPVKSSDFNAVMV